jgi:hypothetical protein
VRNDARPVGEHSPASPVGGEHTDARESVTHDRQSHVVNREAEKRQPQTPDDPVTPSSDSPRQINKNTPRKHETHETR